MEVFLGVMVLFLAGCSSYGALQIGCCLTDAARARWLSRRAGVVGDDGLTLVIGEARALKLLTPPAGGAGSVVWSTRGPYGVGGDAESAPFEVLSTGGEVVRVEPDRLHLVLPEETDTFGHKLRRVLPGQRVRVFGRLERRGGAAVLVDAPGVGVIVGNGGGWRLAAAGNFMRGAAALGLVGLFALVVVLAHLGD